LKISNENGVSLVGTIIGLGVTTLVLLALSSLNSDSMKSAMLDSLELNIVDAQRAIYAAIANPTAWQNTVGQNAFLNCLASKNCQNGNSSFIKIYDSTPISPPASPGRILADLPGSSLGIGALAMSCNTFAVGGNASCPVQYQITATISCHAAVGVTCPVNAIPVVRLSGHVQLGLQIPDQYKVMNTNVYNFVEDKVGANDGYTYICGVGRWNGAGAFVPEAAFDGSGLPVLNSVQVAKVMMKIYPSDGINWGLQCIPPYNPVGCTGVFSALNDPSASFVPVNPLVSGGCYGTTHNLGDATLSITCCGSS
jgi:hypothetical protein